MIDGLKILNVPADAIDLNRNELLHWELKVSQDEGELTGQIAHYSGLTFIIKNGNTKLFGSLHKYHNAGLHNYNDFPFSALVASIEDICKKFKIDANTALLNNVEFGVNLVVPFPLQTFLNRVIAHKGKGFNIHREQGKHYLQCEHEQFILKLYDKGLQYGLPENIMRFEVKVIKMQFFEQKKIRLTTLQNLTKPNILEQLGEILFCYWNEILFDEPKINPDLLTTKEKELLLTGRNPKFWADLYQPEKRNERDYKLKLFRELTATHTDGLPGLVGKMIADKWKQLSETLPETSSEIPQIYRPEINKVTLSAQKRNQPPYLPKKLNSANLHFKYRVNLQNNRKCKVSGLDIAHQKERSIFFSQKSIEIFADLWNQSGLEFRQYKRKRKEPESYYKAHNVRNKDSNPRNNLKRRLKKSIAQTLLFDPKEVIRLSNEHRNILNSRSN